MFSCFVLGTQNLVPPVPGLAMSHSHSSAPLAARTTGRWEWWPVSLGLRDRLVRTSHYVYAWYTLIFLVLIPIHLVRYSNMYYSPPSPFVYELEFLLMDHSSLSTSCKPWMKWGGIARPWPCRRHCSTICGPSPPSVCTCTSRAPTPTQTFHAMFSDPQPVLFQILHTISYHFQFAPRVAWSFLVCGTPP